MSGHIMTHAVVDDNYRNSRMKIAGNILVFFFLKNSSVQNTRRVEHKSGISAGLLYISAIKIYS